MLDIECIYIKHILNELYKNDLISFEEWQNATNYLVSNKHHNKAIL
ncbi:hypothetical protein IY230_05715 [Acholeplasma laidlawii]|nr:hypothetical protein [Acholeplasma laidlawii]MBG0763098.1 hypothetical protein [Acholeplasma laidlawii]